jgi:CRISPR-associated protein Cas2
MMLVLITYDVSVDSPAGVRRLRHVAKACKNKAQRVQNSVFECWIENADWLLLKHDLEQIIDPEKDSLRYYYLGTNWQHRVEHHGAKASYNPEGPLIL